MALDREFAAAGLVDLRASDAQARLELLEWLVSEGFAIDELVGAHAENNLGGIASDRRVADGARLPIDEAVGISGLTPLQVDGYATAFGFTNLKSTGGQLGLTKAEAETLSIFAALGTMFSDAEALGFVRVVGSSLARIADAAVSLFLTDIENPHIESQGSELALAQKSFEAVGLLDEFVPLLNTVLRRHITQATERNRAASSSDERRLGRYAVGFIDLVGFTPMSQGLSAAELGAFIRDFEGQAHDAVTAHGARLVKLIGDEVMFAAPDPDDACEVAQTLMVRFRTDRGDVLPRGGLAYGDVLVRGGDFYGDTVNIASRLADSAVARELLVTEDLAAATRFEFEPAGRRQLKGFVQPVPVRAKLFEVS